MTNVDVDWSVSLDSGDTWELFGGEVIKFSGVGNACDSVTLHADNSEDLDWQTVDDDVLSVCLSAASSRSCLHSSGPHETCNTCSDAQCGILLYLKYYCCSTTSGD